MLLSLYQDFLIQSWTFIVPVFFFLVQSHSSAKWVLVSEQESSCMYVYIALSILANKIRVAEVCANILI